MTTSLARLEIACPDASCNVHPYVPLLVRLTTKVSKEEDSASEVREFSTRYSVLRAQSIMVKYSEPPPLSIVCLLSACLSRHVASASSALLNLNL